MTLNILSDDTASAAKRYYNEIVSVLEEKQMGYDLTVVQIEHREPPKGDPYDVILFFSKPCIHIKGKKTKYLYFHPIVEKLLKVNHVSYQPATNSYWARIPVDKFEGFYALAHLLEELYEECMRASDSFGCCGSYLECSEAGRCIKSDIMFAGKCQYRQNLKQGRIFYGSKKNI